jgi:hypothetical protein
MSVLHAGRYFCAGAVVIAIAWGAVKPRAFPGPASEQSLPEQQAVK